MKTKLSSALLVLLSSLAILSVAGAREPAAVADDAVVLTSAHDHDCPPVTHKICKPVCEKKKVTKVVYDCREEDFCLPKCPSLLDRLLGRHGDCFGHCGACQECEKPRTRKVLIKRVKTEEVDVIKCVPETVCEPAGCLTP